MSTVDSTRIELLPERTFSNRCEVRRDGVAISRTAKCYWPMRTSFDLDGRLWQVAPHTPGGRGIDLIREILMGGALARGCFGLSSVGAEPIAIARECGFFDFSYVLTLGGQPARLNTDKKVSRYDLSSAAGGGSCERLPGTRGAAAVLPASLATEVQVFIALLALRRWIGLSHSD